MSPERTNWAAVAFGLSLAWFAAFQMFKLPPVLPVLIADYGYGLILAGGFMSIYAVAGLLLSFGFSRRIERSGWRRPLLGALAVMACGNALALLWPSSGWIMLGARTLEGIGFAVLAIIGPTLANRQAHARHLPLVIGATAAWIPIGQLAAAFLAPQALALQGWQSLWLLGLLGCLLFGLWSLRLPQEEESRNPSRRAAEHGAGTPDPAERRARRLLYLAAGLFFLWAGQYFAYMTWLPEYLVSVQGLDLSDALLGYSLPVSLLIVFTLVTGLMLRLGVPLGPLLVGSIALQVGVWWLIPVSLEGWRGIASLVVYGIGAGITPTCLFAMPSVAAGRARAAASAFGIIMTGRNLGVLSGPILLAEVLRVSGSWDLASPVFGTVTAMALAIAACLAVLLPARGR